MINSLNDKEELKMQSVCMLTCSYQFRKSLRAKKRSYCEILSKFNAYRHNQLVFKAMIEKIRGSYEYNPFDNVNSDMVEISKEMES